MEVLLGKSLVQLQELVESIGLPRFSAKQIANWLYVKRVLSFDEMTNISLKGRELLKKHFSVGRSLPIAEAVSKDGTRKYLFQVGKQYVESVYIPDEGRATLCVSTQAGCKMGCRFCMTGTLGFHGQLSVADILNQVLFFPLTSDIPHDSKVLLNSTQLIPLTNLVYMGEGEPMDNIEAVLESIETLTANYGCAWSPKRITVSSVGVIPGIQRLIENTECHLAISLHNPFSSERQQIMPAENPYPIHEVVNFLRQYDFSHQRRLSFEYICFGGVNDTPRHAKEIVRLLRGLDCRINLIRFHQGANTDHASSTLFAPSDETQMTWLRDYLNKAGLTTTIRRSRGEDILAACGMLVNALQPITR